MRGRLWEIIRVKWYKFPTGKRVDKCPVCLLPYRTMITRRSENGKNWATYRHEWIEITTSSEIGPLTEIVKLNHCLMEIKPKYK